MAPVRKRSAGRWRRYRARRALASADESPSVLPNSVSRNASVVGVRAA